MILTGVVERIRKNLSFPGRRGFWIFVGIVFLIVAGEVFLSSAGRGLSGNPYSNKPEDKAIIVKDKMGIMSEYLEEDVFEKVFFPVTASLNISKASRVVVMDSEGKETLDTKDARILRILNDYLQGMKPFTNHDKVNNNLDIKNTLIIFDQHEKEREYPFVDNTLYNTGYLVINEEKVEPAYDLFRYLHSFYLYPKWNTYVSTDVDRLFGKYDWTVSFRVGTVTETLPTNLLHKAGEFPTKIYWAYNNALSKTIGLDLIPYLGKSVQVEIYRLNESLPPSMFPRQEARGIIVRFNGIIIGSYIDAGRHDSFACSLDRKPLTEATGQGWNEWISKYIDYGDEIEKRLSELSPEDIIKTYFEALDKGDERLFYATQTRMALIQNLSSNMDFDQLLKQSFSDNNVKKAKLLEIKKFELGNQQKDTLEYSVLVDFDFKQMITSPDGRQPRFVMLSKESEGIGWRISGVGTGP